MHTITQSWYQLPGYNHRNPALTPTPVVLHSNPAARLDQTTVRNHGLSDPRTSQNITTASRPSTTN
jgi:hypothetical protein